MTRRQYKGGAAAKTLSSGLGDGSTTAAFTLTADPGGSWPDGSTGPFIIAVDRGLSTEEKILCDSRTGASITPNASGRGYDNTTGVAHSAGSSVVEHVLGAIDLDEPNAHINTTSLDQHTQYLNTTRHDITTRHAFGAALGTPSAAANVGAAASAGVSGVPARDDHVHTGAALGSVATPVTTTTSYTVTGSMADVTGASITFTALTGRRYRVRGMLFISNCPAQVAVIAQLNEGATALITNTFVNMDAASAFGKIYLPLEYIVAPTAASHTYKIQAQYAGASAPTVNSLAFGGQVGTFLTVEDIGT